jgi:hypothetical protein
VIDELRVTGSEVGPVAGELEDGDGRGREAELFWRAAQAGGQFLYPRVVRDEQRGAALRGQFPAEVEQGQRAGRVGPRLEEDLR